MITVALPKGRTLQATLDRFARAGLSPEEDFAATRKLIVPARGAGARFLLLKDPDVPLYVERGAADLGVCGLDHVLESDADLLVPLDLGFGACRLCLAAPRDSGVARGWRSGESSAEKGRSLRVATKYPRSARAFFDRINVTTELIKLHGSVELAPATGLADAILDIVATGRTLRANRLVEVAEAGRSTARFIVNQASLKTRSEAVTALAAGLRRAVEDRAAARAAGGVA